MNFKFFLAPGRRWSWVAACCVALATTALVVWLPAETFFTREPAGFYGWQTDAYCSGQLHLKIAPHPALLALDNPYGPASEPYRIPDVAFYDGRYYIYYGIAPILTCLLPLRWLTGWYATEALGCIVFTLLAGVATLALLHEVRRRHAVDAPPLLRLAVGVMAVFGGGVPCWLAETGPYQLAQISGAAWQAVMLWAGFRAMTRARPLPWLTLASAAWGLVVASRPSLFFIGAALLPCGWAVVRRPRSESGRCLGVAVALVAPAATIGVGLAWLNAARFGSPWEFGMRFNLTSMGDTRDFVFFSWAHAAKNLPVLLGNLPGISDTFPFLTVGWREPVGLLCLPYLLGAGGLIAWLRRPEAERIFSRRALACSAGLTAATAAGPILAFCYLWSRYWLDLLVPWTLAASLGWLALSAAARPSQQRLIAWLAIATACANLAALSAVFFETLY